MDELKHQERRWDRASEREHVTVAMAFPKRVKVLSEAAYSLFSDLRGRAR